MNKAVPIVLGLGLLPLSQITVAQAVAQPNTLAGPVSAFHGDVNTLMQAIQTIEQSSGGKVVDIRFSDTGGTPGYHAVVIKHRRVQFFHIAERGNRAVEIDATSGPAWMLGWRSREDVHFAERASIPLAKAIQTAEDSQNGAPAMAAGIARSASNPDSDVHAYTVLLDVNGAVRRVTIDDSTGEVIADPGALTG
jgi:uncharacterized membrane protein YkoI